MSSTSVSDARSTQDALAAARHICQEARVVLTSLRGGPPSVARGELAQDLMELRVLTKARHEAPMTEPMSFASRQFSTSVQHEAPPAPVPIVHQDRQQSIEDEEGSEGAVLVQRRDAQAGGTPESPIPTSKLCNIAGTATPKIKEFNQERHGIRGLEYVPENVGPFAHPFLAVVMDPRAAGPHTLVALRSLFRLLDQGSLVQPSSNTHGYHVVFEPLMRGVLACKFEQTDAGADEAVEMAIADLLNLIVNLDHVSIPPETLMDAFNTVFVTRNTFVHSPALCYHFEDVLSSMVVAVFGDLDSNEASPRLILEFLVNQLLHTPLVGGQTLDESAQEAQMAHDATRVLCLHLVQTCLRTGWGTAETDKVTTPPPPSLEAVNEELPNQRTINEAKSWEEKSLLAIIQDDLCLSLLMTGQAIWAYHDASSNISPGVISLEVLSEICATLSTLWNTILLRRHLVSQFESIFTGFYQRALALLRKRRTPTDSASFNANLVFDAEVEIILESLVDVLCLHDEAEEEGGALETLFSTYDCHMNRSDVTSGLMIELCRCCGGDMGEDGEHLSEFSSRMSSTVGTGTINTPPASGMVDTVNDLASMMPGEHWRPVPAHLKELCVEALLGAMKSLFHDDHPSAEALARRLRRSALNENSPAGEVDSTTEGESRLRQTKSRKKLMREAAALFNKKSTEGIQFLVTSGLVPTPVTPASVAAFLRNAIVVGLDKKAVGAYLGEVGKAPVAGKSPPTWERDRFHKEVLTAYCSLFSFERQPLLDGLRMFLSSFRLPGEAQQIDRILQEFANSCGQTCAESAQGRLKLFSPDPKKASDAAYLLSFSIIMLNTDQHNDNIREDRKMTMEDFVKNNTDYGRDITEPGHEFPREFLEGIFESIRDEQIRTEGEGADGHMTVERWKDVLRGPVDNEEDLEVETTSESDADDVRELVVETMWMPVLSTIGALWGVVSFDDHVFDGQSGSRLIADAGHSGMLGAQGARLGMDMALDMLRGIQKLGRKDIFKSFFLSICDFSGLLGDYTTNAVERTWSFVNSVESQSAVAVAIQIAIDAGSDIGPEGWKSVWGIVFELRDLKLLRGGGGLGFLAETDPDILSPESRREWTMQLVKGDIGGVSPGKGNSPRRGIFASLFGSNNDSEASAAQIADVSRNDGFKATPTVHGKEESVLWDELAASDDEEEIDSTENDGDESQPINEFGGSLVEEPPPHYGSAGAAFENILIHEDIMEYQQEITPITGLERVDDTRQFQKSPRARVRKRLDHVCDFTGLVSESRFLDETGIQHLLRCLIQMIQCSSRLVAAAESSTAPQNPRLETEDKPAADTIPISPASEAFAEVLICEIAIKNRDRLSTLWEKALRDHYLRRLSSENAVSGSSETEDGKTYSRLIDPGIEKCVTGLLRICSCAITREGVASSVLSSLTVIIPVGGEANAILQNLDKHLGEGLWRICRSVDGLQTLTAEGWDGALNLIHYCSCRGVGPPSMSSGLPEDDPVLQAFRSLHLMLNAPELENELPFSVLRSIRSTVVAGERRNYPKLSIAGLDLLQLMHVRLESRLSTRSSESKGVGQSESTKPSEVDYASAWFLILEGVADAARYSRHACVREHALSLLTDAFLDTHGRSIPPDQLFRLLAKTCIPLVRERVLFLLSNYGTMQETAEEAMTEFELCMGLLFKPFLHHLKVIMSSEPDMLEIWKNVLGVLEDLFKADGTPEEGQRVETQSALTREKVLLSAQELAREHLRNALMVLLASDVLLTASTSHGDISEMTWSKVEQMKNCKDLVVECKQSALNPEKPTLQSQEAC